MMHKSGLHNLNLYPLTLDLSLGFILRSYREPPESWKTRLRIIFQNTYDSQYSLGFQLESASGAALLYSRV